MESIVKIKRAVLRLTLNGRSSRHSRTGIADNPETNYEQPHYYASAARSNNSRTVQTLSLNPLAIAGVFFSNARCGRQRLYHAAKTGPICGRPDPSALVRRDPVRPIYGTSANVTQSKLPQPQLVRREANHFEIAVIDVGQASNAAVDLGYTSIFASAGRACCH